MFTAFTRAFYQSDVLMVLPIYAASEAPIDGVDSEKLVEGIKSHGHKDACFAPDFTQALSMITHKAKAGDMVLTLGAGDVYTLGEKLVEISYNFV